MSLEVDGVWKSGVWAFTVWGEGVWREGPPIDPEICPKFLFSDIKTKLSGNITNTNLSADIKTKLSAEV